MKLFRSILNKYAGRCETLTDCRATDTDVIDYFPALSRHCLEFRVELWYDWTTRSTVELIRIIKIYCCRLTKSGNFTLSFHKGPHELF